MPITAIVRSGAGDEVRLTFDGSQRVVIGRGAGSDVRLPDASVSHRHASLRAQGAEYVIVDEESTNGTFVGDVRVAPRTSRIVRSGDRVRLGRVWLQILIDQSPVTRDVAMATRDLALALVAEALRAQGVDRTTRVRVVEGPDQGASLLLSEEDRPYVIGRGPQCDLALADADTSRDHVRVRRGSTGVFVLDLGAKNGTWLGGLQVPSDREAGWRPSQMLKMGRTVLALVEPVVDALAQVESAADEVLAPEDEPAALPGGVADGTSPPLPGRGQNQKDAEAVKARLDAAGVAPSVPSSGTLERASGPPLHAARWSAVDLLVMGAALGVLALSLAGLYWLLRG
jgi:pSer/pThr/pTyr-binding forkhead associated (FHA) protein